MSETKSKLGRLLQAAVSGPSGGGLANGVYRMQAEGPEEAVFSIIVENGKKSHDLILSTFT